MKKGRVYFLGLELLSWIVFVRSSSLRVEYFFYSISLFLLGIFRNYIRYNLPLLFISITAVKHYIPRVYEWNHWENQSKISFSLLSAPLAFQNSIATRIQDHIFQRPFDLVFLRDKHDPHHPHSKESGSSMAVDS